MRSSTVKMLGLVLGAAALPGCYVELADESVTIRRSLPVCDAGATSCTFRGVPAAVQEAIPLAIISGETQFTLDLSNQDVFKQTNDVGPLTMKGTLAVNEVTLRMTTAGAAFDGVQHMEVVQLPGPTCTSGCQPRTVAVFDRTAGSASDPSSIVLTGTGANLLDMGGGDIVIRLTASGTLPTVDWNADLALDASISARASVM